jgi:hypothetical protein
MWLVGGTPPLLVRRPCVCGQLEGGKGEGVDNSPHGSVVSILRSRALMWSVGRLELWGVSVGNGV